MKYIEEWRTAIYDGETYEGFEVSNIGRIKSLNYRRTGRAELMKPIDDGNGYLKVYLWKNKEKKRCLVHRLVAETFLPNLEGKPCVNHKIEGDEGKSINMVFFNEDRTVDEEKSTIEWVTYKENSNYGTCIERMRKTLTNGKLSKSVLQLSLTEELIREWPSVSEVSRNGFNKGHVAACCRGEEKSHKGYIWMYTDDYKEKQLKELGYIPLF